MDIETTLALLLGLMVIIYACNDYLIPLLKGKSLGLIEGFSSKYSSLTSSSNLSKTTTFDTNWYLRDPDKPIILNNHISLPVMSLGFYENGSYEGLVSQYFRHHIYPVELEQLTTQLDTIYKFINGDIDMAFIDEELLARFIKRDCKYLTRYIVDQLGLESYDIRQPENIDRLYPPLACSAIGVAFHKDMYLIVNNFSNIQEFLDIKDKTIGVLEDSYYYFMKLAAAYNLDISSKPNGFGMKIERQLRLEDLIANFKTDKYDGLFLAAHPKNLQLLKLTLDKKVRFIHLQNRPTLDARANLKNLNTDQQGTNSKSPPPPPDINRQAIYSASLMHDLQKDNEKESFNSLIKKYFQHVKPRAVNLNKFHTTGNMYSYLETFSMRMILVIRNEIPIDRVRYITRNYVENLNKIRDLIDREQFIPQLDNFSSQEFNYEELLGFDSKIPLATGARDIYKEEGLIYYEEDARCQL
jgi:hypothetical protein